MTMRVRRVFRTEEIVDMLERQMIEQLKLANDERVEVDADVDDGSITITITITRDDA